MFSFERDIEPLFKTDGNAILKTAQFVWIMKEHNELDATMRQRVTDLIRFECQVAPGLFRRNRQIPQDFEGRDDYIGLAYLTQALGEPFAQDILEFGRKHFFIWKLGMRFDGWFPNHLMDPLSPHFESDPYRYREGTFADSWLWRHREVYASLQFAANETPVWFDETWWYFGTAYAGSKHDQDGWMLGALQLEIAKGKTGLYPQARDAFNMRLRRDWGSLNNVFAAYLLHQGGLDHPLAKYAPEAA